VQLSQALRALADAALQLGASLPALEAQAVERLRKQGWQPDYLLIRPL